LHDFPYGIQPCEENHMSNSDHISVFVNHTRITFDRLDQTGRSIKEFARIPPGHVLCLDDGKHCDDERGLNELKPVSDDEGVHIEEHWQFWSIAPAGHGITVTINGKAFEFANAHQTGRALKTRAGIPSTDVLFRQRPGEDEVIPDDARIRIECDDKFHSSPPANYGSGVTIAAQDVGHPTFETVQQPDGWTFLTVADYPLPTGFVPRAIRLLIKLPPQFPDAAPDMFWVTPNVQLAEGAAPQGTSTEMLLGSEWQRFSWHLQPGAWRPGCSTLRDYMRCVRARFEKRN
jgi:hypothetical protein